MSEVGRLVIDLRWLAVEDWNQKVSEQKKLYYYWFCFYYHYYVLSGLIPDTQNDFEWWKEFGFQWREQKWRWERAIQKRAGRRPRRGSWRQRRNQAWIPDTQDDFERREQEWRSQRAIQKKAGRRHRRGSWRQRRGHGRIPEHDVV